MQDYDLELKERIRTAVERIAQIPAEDTVKEPFAHYFKTTAEWILMVERYADDLRSGKAEYYSRAELVKRNDDLYKDLYIGHYPISYACPDCAVQFLGDTHGRLLSFLYAELRGLIGYTFEGFLEAEAAHLEVFIEVYNRFEQEETPSYRAIRDILYWFVSDYCDVLVTERVRQSVDPCRDFAVRIIEESDLTGTDYLYRYGEYVTENEIRTAQFMASLSEEEVQKMADTYTEGYRRGFVHAGKPLEKKMTVNIRYHLGQERMVRKAIENFAKMGLRPVIFRYAMSTVNKKGSYRIGYEGANVNPQFDIDHAEDAAIYLDARFVDRRLGVMRSAYETFRTLAAGHAGPAVIETFGEEPYTPVPSINKCKLNEKQQQLSARMSGEAAQLTNHYIIGSERSFTIIAFPLPSIGKNFEEIFAEVCKVNTLDNDLYTQIQQTIIDALDKGTHVHVLGKGVNHTDLTVQLQKLTDPSKQTIFENCVADVNIPVGEVFTSPVLEGTNGVLHVSQVYLQGLNYDNLEFQFKDGMIADYGCSNFADPEECRNYIAANILFHHESLPIGEFAIGTNTTAYAMAKKFGIGAKLPILIAEKTGPHFAVGDTCYSFEEDNAVYNPDGKEIIARDNSVSLLRKTDPEKAYFGCHTDITIPYEELGLIEVLGENGYRKVIIEDGKFVLSGTEELNKAL